MNGPLVVRAEHKGRNRCLQIGFKLLKFVLVRALDLQSYSADDLDRKSEP